MYEHIKSLRRILNEWGFSSAVQFLKCSCGLEVEHSFSKQENHDLRLVRFFKLEYPRMKNVWTFLSKRNYDLTFTQWEQGFIKVNLLMKHLDLHNNINKYRCIQDGCCREFRHKFSFLRHIKSHKFACEKKAFFNSHSKSKIRNDKNSDSSSSSNDFQNFENIELFSDLNGNISETLSLENYKLDITNNLLALSQK
ncbi:hypothetical protein Avbf_05323 [Armadillidium vulgare]|nr:hypothetical protein Avbf_05323 [Armadillidium vulgare]